MEDKTYYMEDKASRFLSIHFDSVVELLDYEPPWNLRRFNEEMKHGRDSKRGTWLGPTNRTSQDVINGALIGDKVLYEKHLKKMISELRESLGMFKQDYKQRITVSRRRPLHGATGDELDIHRVYQGQLDKAWRTTKREEVAQETKLVTLFIQITGTANYNAVDSLWRAAVAVLLMEELLRAGKSVKIIVGGSSVDVTKSHHSMCVSATVKQYNEKLSVERLAAMSHLGFYRTFGFGAKACQPYELTYGLGRSVDLQDRFMPLQFRQDIHKGHAKLVLLNRSQSLREAKRAVEDAFEQMKEFSNG